MRYYIGSFIPVITLIDQVIYVCGFILQWDHVQNILRKKTFIIVFAVTMIFWLIVFNICSDKKVITFSNVVFIFARIGVYKELNFFMIKASFWILPCEIVIFHFWRMTIEIDVRRFWRHEIIEKDKNKIKTMVYWAQCNTNIYVKDGQNLFIIYIVIMKM